jgi:hypothetical protein
MCATTGWRGAQVCRPPQGSERSREEALASRQCIMCIRCIPPIAIKWSQTMTCEDVASQFHYNPKKLREAYAWQHLIPGSVLARSELKVPPTRCEPRDLASPGRTLGTSRGPSGTLPLSPSRPPWGRSPSVRILETVVGRSNAGETLTPVIPQSSAVPWKSLPTLTRRSAACRSRFDASMRLCAR